MSVQKGALVFPAVCTSCCSATTSWYLMRNDSPALCICKSFFQKSFHWFTNGFGWRIQGLLISHGKFLPLHFILWQSDVAWCSSEPMSVIIFLHFFSFYLWKATQLYSAQRHLCVLVFINLPQYLHATTYYKEECNKKQRHKHILILLQPAIAIEIDFEERVRLHPVCSELTYPMFLKEWCLWWDMLIPGGYLMWWKQLKSYRNTRHFTGAYKPPIPINFHSRNRPCGRFLMAKTYSTGQGPFTLEFTYP